MQMVMKERRSEPHAKRVCGALWDQSYIWLWAIYIIASVTCYAVLSSPCYRTLHFATLSNGCEVNSQMKMDSISRFYHLYDDYYIKVLETNCESGTVQVCVLKELSTNTSIVFEHAPAEESPVCDLSRKPNCLRSLCYHDNYLGFSLLHPNQSYVSYIILDIGANNIFRKNLTDQPQGMRDVWTDMIPGCHTLNALRLACSIIAWLISAIWIVECCLLLPCIPYIYQKCKR